MEENGVLKGDFKTLLKHFCLESTVLGLKYFYLYPDRISRCFWAVTLILIVTFACNLTYLLYGRFAEMPTRITIENQFEPLPTLPFPAIAICTPNQMTLSSMRHFNKTLIDGNTTVDLDSALPQLLGFYATIARINDEELRRLQSLIIRNRYTVKREKNNLMPKVPEVMGLMPQNCEDFLKFCMFKRQERPCSELFRPVLTRQGLCCSFNSLYYYNGRRNEKNPNFQPHMATLRGVNDALRVVVDYEPDDALPRTLFHVGAIRMMFTDWSEFPAEDTTILVYPNVEAFLAIHGTYTYCSEEVASLASWSRECLFDHERRLALFPNNYHNSDCDHLCYVRSVERHCHCHPIYVPHVGTEKNCDVTKIRCISQINDLPYESNMDCDCPRDCESRMYTVDPTIGNLKALDHMTYNPYANVTFKDSTTILNFYFPNSVYVKKKQETVMSLISLASNLGGIFGLCMGVSVVSVLEIAFYTRIAVSNYLRKRLRRALKNQVQNYRET